MAEHSAVNRRVVGSNPTRGAKEKAPKFGAFLFNKSCSKKMKSKNHLP